MLKCVLFACKETSNQLNKPSQRSLSPILLFPSFLFPIVQARLTTVR